MKLDRVKRMDLVIAVVVTAAALGAFYGELSVEDLAFYGFLAVSAIGLRELGQRALAGRMRAEVNTEISEKGSLLTLMIAFISSVTVYSVALILPIKTDHGTESHKLWGQSVDAIWSRRDFLISLSGVSLLTAVSTVSASLGFERYALGLILFTLSQMIPLRDLIVEGSTDGAFILFSSGFTWLIVTGFNLMVLSFVYF